MLKETVIKFDLLFVNNSLNSENFCFETETLIDVRKSALKTAKLPSKLKCQCTIRS